MRKWIGSFAASARLRIEARQDARVESGQRQLQKKADSMRLKAGKLRSLPFEMAVIERDLRRESSVGEARVERPASAPCESSDCPYSQLFREEGVTELIPPMRQSDPEDIPELLVG